MKDIPEILATKADYLNSINYALDHNTACKEKMIMKLKELEEAKYCLALKEGVSKAENDIQLTDFEQVEDPQALYYKIGLTDDEIDTYINQLSQ